MQQSNRYVSVLIVSILAVTIMPGGCPFQQALELDDKPSAKPVTPGVYWVEQFDEGLAYYEFPQTRADVGMWVTIAEDDTDWYDIPGWYELAADSAWVYLPELADITLDDAIQTHDPAPIPE